MVLKPRERILFNPGPVNLDPAIKENLFNIELCHRQPEFDELVASVGRRLSALLGFPPDSFMLGLLHGSGTLAVSAALSTFVRGRVLVIDNGLYCRRILDGLSAIDGATAIHLDLGVGRRIDGDALEETVRKTRPDWIAMVHHETTTGLLNRPEQVLDVSRDVGARVFVDAVSSLGAHPVDNRTDVVCFNSSKCLESLPGIAGVFWRSDLPPHDVMPALDIVAHTDAIPTTPNVQAFVAFDVALDLLAQEDRPARYRRLAHHVWAVGSRSFEPLLAEEDRSHVLTSFRLGGRPIDDVFGRALSAGMVIYPGQATLRSEIFRIANMGAAIDEHAIDNLFDVIA